MENNQNRKYVAKTLFGLEHILAEEIKNLGGSNIEILTRAVIFEGDRETMYRINYCSYTALRILMPIFEFEASTQEELYDKMKAFPWETTMTILDTFLIQPVVNSEVFTHSKFLAQKSKDAIADRFVDRQGKRPSVNTEDPKFIINVQVSDTTFRVSLDCTGESLHKRGYRVETGPAPINEVLAAGIIQLSEWDYKTTFVDPMCGSGTFLIEAALQATNTPPGKYRKHFLFMNFEDFDRRTWVKVKNQAIKSIKKEYPVIMGYDLSEKLIQVCEHNVRNSGLDEYIYLKQSDFFKLEIRAEPTHIIFNPPYGERMHKIGVEDFYEKIGSKLKKEFVGKSIWLLSSNKEAISYIGLKASKKYTLFNGKLEVKLLKYELYSGSKKTE